MREYNILWADDEIELLKPHIIFLEEKGYVVTAVNSGSDALEEISKDSFDMIFLDENMPGLSGLETLNILKKTDPNLPIVMLTKSEEEALIDEAIGSKISDYLIKPFRPSQILLIAKKILENKRIVSEKTTLNYQRDFQQLSLEVMDANDFEDWMKIYKKLIYWELEISHSEDNGMEEVLQAQKAEASANFSSFVKNNYEDWISNSNTSQPLLSHQLLKEKVFPHVGDTPVFFIVIDNLRYDQWKFIEPVLSTYFTIEEEMYTSILPTTTAYARNALFAGMTPSDIYKHFPEQWIVEDDEHNKNQYEKNLLATNLSRNKINERFSFQKITKNEEGKQLLSQIPNLINNPFNVIIYSFIDMLSHARTDMQMIKELTPDEAAYRSITKSWFVHSPLFDVLKELSTRKVKVVITTDHGTIRVNKAEKIIADKKTNHNLRYKVGKSLLFNEKSVFFHREPENIGLPKTSVSSTYVFALENNFFAYPNNYNSHVRQFQDTFQNGGVSMEEMLIPLVTLTNK